MGLALAPAGGDSGGLGGCGLRCAAVCASACALLLLEGAADDVATLPLRRYHGAPRALCLLAPRGRDAPPLLLVVGDASASVPTASLWAWPAAGSAARVRCVAAAGACPRGARRRSAAAAVLRTAASLAGPGSSLARRLARDSPQPLRCSTSPDAQAAAFTDAAGGTRLLRVTPRSGGPVVPSLAFVPTPHAPHAADAAFWGPDALMLSISDASAMVMPLAADPDEAAAVALPAVASLAALPPHAGGARRCLAACTGPDAAPGSYRLLTLHERTPAEAVRALTSRADWDAALAAAAAHGLDDAAVTAVHAARCAAEMPHAGTASEALALLSAAPDRRWAAAAAATAAPRDAAAARAVLSAGLEDTSRLCLGDANAAPAPDAAQIAAMLSDPPRAAALRLRLALLRGRERLASLEAVHGAGCGAGPAFAALRDGPPAAAAAAFAAAGSVRATETLLRRHRRAIMITDRSQSQVIPSRSQVIASRRDHLALGAVLDALPPAMPPAEYAALLPWAPLWLHAPPPPSSPPDWCECADVAAALATAASGGDSEADALRCATEAIAAAGQPPAAPSALWAARWAQKRCLAIDAAAGALRHAASLAAAAQEGLPALAAACGEATSAPFLEALGAVGALRDAAEALAAAVSAGAAPQGAQPLPWELLPLSAFAALSDAPARLALLLEGATPENAPRALAAAAAFLARSGLDGAARGAAFADWAHECAVHGGIETIAAMFCAADESTSDDAQAAAALDALLPSASARAAAGLRALFASRRAEASALEACGSLAAALPSDARGVAEASAAVEAARLLAAHSGAAPTPADVRDAGGDADAAAALVRRLAARLAGRAEPPGESAWGALWRDLSAAADVALHMAPPDVARVFLLHGPLAARPPALAAARRVLAGQPPDADWHRTALEAATRRLARTPASAPEGAELAPSADEASSAVTDDEDDAAAFEDADSILALAPDSADCRSAGDALAALRLLPSLGVSGACTSSRSAAALLPRLRAGPAAALELVAAALAARPRAWQAAGPLLELGRLLGLRRGASRNALQLAIAEAAASEAAAEGAPPPPLARELCLALARARHAPAAALAAAIGLQEAPSGSGDDAPPSPALRRELLAFALCHAEPPKLPRLLAAWQALQCCGNDDDNALLDSMDDGTKPGGALRGAAAAAYAASRAGLGPDDDVAYGLAYDAASASALEAVPDAGAVVALAMAPTAAPTGAAVAALTGGSADEGKGALALGIAAHALRAAIAAAEASRADVISAGGDAATAEAAAQSRIIKAMASPASLVLAELDASPAPLPPAAAAAVAAARALAARQSAAADGAALAAAAPRVDAAAFASGDADHRRAVLLAVAADCGADDVAAGGAGLPPALAAATGLASSAGLSAWDLAWARAVALLTWRDAGIDAGSNSARRLAPLRPLLHARAAEAAAALPRDVWPALPPRRPARAACYLRELAAAYNAAGDEDAASRAERAASAADAFAGFDPAADVTLWLGPDGGAPAGGAAPALAAAAANASTAVAVAEAVATLPVPPDGLTPSAALAAAALRALLLPRAIGGDADVAARWRTAAPLLAHPRVAAAAAAAVAAAAALGAAPPPSLGAAAAAESGATAAALCAAFAKAAPRQVRREMLKTALDRFAQTKGDNKNLAALAARATAAVSRLDAVAAAQEAWSGWAPPELDALEAASSDALNACLSAAAARGAPFTALRAASTPPAAAAAVACALDAALVALSAASARPGAPPSALRKALACLAGNAAGDDALSTARGAAAAALAAFAAGPAPPAARVVALEAMTALPVTWHGWVPPEPPKEEPAVEEEAAPTAEPEIAPVAAEVPAPVAAVADAPPTPAPVEEAVPAAAPPMPEAAVLVPVAPPPAPAPASAPPAPPPRAPKAAPPAFDAAAALLAARSAAALDAAGCTALDVTPSDVASPTAALALLARVLARDGTVPVAAGAALVTLWEASAPWGVPSAAPLRPLRACWMALATAAVTRADDVAEEALVAAADAAAGGESVPPLLDAADAEALVSLASAPGATHAGLRVAAAMALMCPSAEPRAAAAAALEAASVAAEAADSAALLAVTPRLALLLAAADALPTEPGALLRAVASSAAHALANGSAADAASASLVLTHAAARLAAARRHAVAAALLLAAARTPAPLASLEGGLILAQRVFSARARASQPRPQAAPGTQRTASAAAAEALEVALPQRCAAASAALVADLRT